MVEGVDNCTQEKEEASAVGNTCNDKASLPMRCGIDAMRGIYNADFTEDVLPQAALRLHAVNCTQPLQGCITIGSLNSYLELCIYGKNTLLQFNEIWFYFGLAAKY